MRGAPGRPTCGVGVPRAFLGTLLVLAIVVGGTGLLPGCAPESRYRLLSKLFDGVPPPGTPPKPRRARRVARVEPPAPPPEPVVLEEALQEVQEPQQPRYETYADVLAALPKDLMGNVDWVAAARQELIQPRPGIDPEATAIPPMPLDVRLDPGIPNFEVVFPHEAHTYWLRCDNCHPAIFQMRAGADPITMAKIFEGEYCGRCHGKVAFPPQTGCPRCHPGLLGGAG